MLSRLPLQLGSSLFQVKEGKVDVENEVARTRWQSRIGHDGPCPTANGPTVVHNTAWPLFAKINARIHSPFISNYLHRLTVHLGQRMSFANSPRYMASRGSVSNEVMPTVMEEREKGE